MCCTDSLGCAGGWGADILLGRCVWLRHELPKLSQILEEGSEAEKTASGPCKEHVPALTRHPMSACVTVLQPGSARRPGKNMACADWFHQESASRVSMRFRGHTFVGTLNMPTIDSCFDRSCHSDVDIVKQAEQDCRLPGQLYYGLKNVMDENLRLAIPAFNPSRLQPCRTF